MQSRAGIFDREGTLAESEVGVRVTMLGAAGSHIYTGDGPLADSPPDHRLDGHPEPSCPLVLVRRKAKAATYAAVHEPYSDRLSIEKVSLLQETTDGIGIKVEADGFSDRLLVRFGSASNAMVIRSPDGEAFRFSEYGFLRTSGQTVVARGRIEAFRLRAPSGDLTVTVHGEKKTAVVRDGFVIWGDLVAEEGNGRAPASLATPETRASIHSWFVGDKLPPEIGRALRAVHGDGRVSPYKCKISAGKLTWT